MPERREVREPHTSGVHLEDYTSAPLNRLNSSAAGPASSRSMSGNVTFGNAAMEASYRVGVDPRYQSVSAWPAPPGMPPRPPGLPPHIPWPPPPPPPGWMPAAPMGAMFPPPPPAFPTGVWGPPAADTARGSYWPPPPPHMVPPTHAIGRGQDSDLSTTEDERYAPTRQYDRGGYAERHRTSSRGPPPPTQRSATPRTSRDPAANRSTLTNTTRAGTPTSSVVARARQVADANRSAAHHLLSSQPTPSQLEVQRIRSLRSGAADHFIRRSTSPEEGVGGHETRNDRVAFEAELRARREALVNSRRNNADLQRERNRSATPTQSARPRPASPSASVRPTSFRTPTLKQLKGDIPDVRRAIADGVTPRNGSRTTTPATAYPEDVQKQAAEYLKGIQDLYSRMRDSYVEFKRNPDAFIARPTAYQSPPRFNRHDTSAATSGPNASSYVPLRMPAAPPAQPSAEAQRLREELDKLERQWQRLDARRAHDTDSTADEGVVPRTRDSVLGQVSEILGKSTATH